MSCVWMCNEVAAGGASESLSSLDRVYPLEFVPPVEERALASESIPIPAGTLDEGFEEESGSLPGEELDRGRDGCL
jgi:hypothetical protein